MTETVIDEPEVEEEVVPLRPRGPITKILHAYRRAASGLTTALGIISVFAVFAAVVVSVVNVILRRVGAEIGRSITSNALIEWQWYLFTILFVTALAYVLREGINVRVDFWFGNQSDRTKSWIDLIGHLFGLLPFAYIGLRYSWSSVQTSWMLNEQSPDPGGLPRAPIKTVLMAGFAFIMIQGIAEVFRVIEELVGTERRGELEEPALAGGQSADVSDFDLDRSILVEESPSVT